MIYAIEQPRPMIVELEPECQDSGFDAFAFLALGLLVGYTILVIGQEMERQRWEDAIEEEEVVNELY